jgi:L-threonylcarbamoyladenylate synthase
MNFDQVVTAVRILRSGGLIGLPTETVYGLAADAENELAVRRIFAAKGRPVDHPLIVHLAEASRIDQWAIEIPTDARKLADVFWPGPLTIILRRSHKAAPAVTGGLPTIGLRVPEHPLALAVLKAFSGGLAAPSANRFGRVSPTTAEHVREELGDQVELILDGGPCSIGLESTIVDLSGDEPTLLRPGAITPRQLEAVLGRPLGDPEKNTTRASGRLASHYAPRAAVEVVTDDRIALRAGAWLGRGKRVAAAVFAGTPLPNQVERIVLPDDVDGFARELYGALRRADALGVDAILVVPPPEMDVGIAIVDRLRKAAAAAEENAKAAE